MGILGVLSVSHYSTEIGTGSKVKWLLKKGTLNHVKGFVMNKLFEKGCLGAVGSHHAKHMPVRDLRTGYDPKYHRLFDRAVGELRTEGLIPSSRQEPVEGAKTM